MNTRSKLIVAGIVFLLSGVLLVSNAVARNIISTAHGNVVNNAPSGSDETASLIFDASEPLPEGPEVDLIKSLIENGWQLRLEAGLHNTRGQEANYKEQLRQYYSATPTNRGSAELDVDKARQGTPEVPPEKTDPSSKPFQFVGPEASELERQWNFIDYGRYNENLANFRVISFGIDSITYLKISIEDNQATVVVDIKYWSEFVHTNPDGTEVTSRPHGGERHTFVLINEKEGWRIASDTFTIISGFEP